MDDVPSWLDVEADDVFTTSSDAWEAAGFVSVADVLESMVLFSVAADFSWVVLLLLAPFTAFVVPESCCFGDSFGDEDPVPVDGDSLVVLPQSDAGAVSDTMARWELLLLLMLSGGAAASEASVASVRMLSCADSGPTARCRVEEVAGAPALDLLRFVFLVNDIVVDYPKRVVTMCVLLRRKRM